MLRLTSLFVILAMSSRSFSMSAPFLPMTTPGRAEWIVMRASCAGRSMTMLRDAGLRQALGQELAELQILCSSGA